MITGEELLTTGPGIYPDFEDMGRVVAEEWQEHFEKVAQEEIANRHVELELFEQPGVLYVMGRDLVSAYAEERIPEDVITTEDVVRNLLARSPSGLLRAEKAARVPVYEFSLIRNRDDPHIYNLRLRIGDVASKFAFSKHVIRTEKSTVNREVGLDGNEFAPLSKTKKSKHFIQMGVLLDPKGTLAPDHVDHLDTSLKGPVILDPLGAMGYRYSP